MLDSILKSRDITLSTKVCLVKAVVFPVIIYGCVSWTIKKAECRRIDAFEMWCWRRLLRVPWTARRSHQSILKEISPGCWTRKPGMLQSMGSQRVRHDWVTELKSMEADVLLSPCASPAAFWWWYWLLHQLLVKGRPRCHKQSPKDLVWRKLHEHKKKQPQKIWVGSTHCSKWGVSEVVWSRDKPHGSAVPSGSMLFQLHSGFSQLSPPKRHPLN